jgi:hypothetical protein
VEQPIRSVLASYETYSHEIDFMATATGKRLLFAVCTVSLSQGFVDVHVANQR